MNVLAMARGWDAGWTRIAGALLLTAGLLIATDVGAQQGGASDPRVGLTAGLSDAGQAARGMELLANVPRPEGFVSPAGMGNIQFSNSDLAFRENFAFLGNFNGFNVYDISDPRSPRLHVSVICPGGQGDLSVYGDLLFMSVEETRGRIDCGAQGTSGQVDPERFRGVRIFDISDVGNPTQIAAVQTCRGSHTHTLVEDANDPSNLYVYVSGTGVARPGEELEGCSPVRSPEDPNTSYWSIAVIRVPLDAPANARVIGEPRVFADQVTGEIAGLWRGGDHGEGTQRTSMTNQCHDITAYPEIGLAAGACAGNGILFDISNPALPVRIDAVTDPNFAYWHSATFNNDGTKVIFTDEWGGGTSARCRASDAPEWGANAIFDVVDGKLQFASYYKLPAPQAATENCVAHNGSLIPVPGRDIKVQAWYQGGISVFDFTDAANPVEIAFFDRGPIRADELVLGGYWSAYWYNGYIYGSEMERGLDVLTLVPSEHLSANEIEAANLIRYAEFNAQHQPGLTWPASFVVARAYLDQLERGGAVPADRIATIAAELRQAEGLTGSARQAALTRLADRIAREASGTDRERVEMLASSVRELAGAP